MCLIFVIMAWYQLIWLGLLAPGETWHKTIWNRKLVSYGRYLFFMVNSTQMYQLLEPEQLSNSDYILAIVAALTRLQRLKNNYLANFYDFLKKTGPFIAFLYYSNILGYFPDLLLIVVTLTGWCLAYEFAQSLQLSETISPTNSGKLDQSLGKSMNQSDWPRVYVGYKFVREILHMINKLHGSLFTVYLANTLLFQATGMDVVLVTQTLRYQIQLLFFIISSVGLFILAADVVKQVCVKNILLS